MKEEVLHTYGFNLMYAGLLVNQIPDPQMAEQPKPAMNHAAWVIGHLANTCDFMGSMLDLDPACPPSWSDLFGGGSTPTNDRARYPDKQTLLDALANGHQRVGEAFAQATAAALAAPLPNEKMRQRFATVGKLLVFGLTAHEMVHLGQLSAWRRANGLAPVM